MTYHLKVTKRNNAEYAQIVETVYDFNTKKSKSIAIESFGDLVKRRVTTPNIDELIQKKIKELNKNKDIADKVKIDRLTNKLPYTDADALSTSGALIRKYGGVFYRKIWENLNLHTLFKTIVRNSSGKAKINYDLDLAVFYLTYMRILFPGSKSKTYSQRTEQIFDLQNISLDNIYDSLAAIAKRKDYIIGKLNENLENIYARVKTIAFYDVTTFYFESFDSDELRARGMSKENKTNEVQVVLGLLVDGEGIPINYELFRGNTSEMKTIIEVVNKYRQSNGLDKVTVVADRGLNSTLNLQELSTLGFDYIVAQSIDKLSAKVKEEVFNEEWDSITYDDKSNEIFKVKTINLEDNNNKIIVTWSASRQAHDIKVLNERYQKSKELLEKGNGAIDASFTHGVRQFIKKANSKQKVEYETNDKLYQKRLNIAGYYALRTSKVNQDSKEVYHNLRQLWHIEECFRVMKSNLDTRPVFVWTTDRIKGHFLICYLALVLERLSYYKVKQAKIDISNHNLIELLSKLTICQPMRHKPIWVKLSNYGSEELDSQDDELIKQVLGLVGIEPLNSIDNAASISSKIKCKLKLSI